MVKVVSRAVLDIDYIRRPVVPVHDIGTVDLESLRHLAQRETGICCVLKLAEASCAPLRKFCRSCRPTLHRPQVRGKHVAWIGRQAVVLSDIASACRYITSPSATSCLRIIPQRAAHHLPARPESSAPGLPILCRPSASTNTTGYPLAVLEFTTLERMNHRIDKDRRNRMSIAPVAGTTPCRPAQDGDVMVGLGIGIPGACSARQGRLRSPACRRSCSETRRWKRRLR